MEGAPLAWWIKRVSDRAKRRTFGDGIQRRRAGTGPGCAGFCLAPGAIGHAAVDGTIAFCGRSSRELPAARVFVSRAVAESSGAVAGFDFHYLVLKEPEESVWLPLRSIARTSQL